MLWGGGIFNLKCVLIEFFIPNLSLTYFVYQKYLKLAFKPGFVSKFPSEFMGMCCEIHKVYFVAKNWILNANIQSF